MKPYKQLMLGFVLIVSLACGALPVQPEVSSVPTSAPGAVNTYIAQTAEVAYTQTAFAAPPTPTSTSTPFVTETPPPTINVYIEQLQLDSDSLLIIGQLTGTLAETDYQSYATLSLYDSQKQKLLEQETPCAQLPREGDKLCLFVFSISELPADYASYQITGEIHLGNSLILASHTEGFLDEGEAQVNANGNGAQQNPSASLQPVQPTASPQLAQPAVSISKGDVSIFAHFPSLFYRPENGSSVSVDVTYFGDPALANASNVEICASIVEQRRYESGKVAQVTLTDDCKEARFSGSDKSASASTNFFFTPSGYGFVLVDSPDGRYRISDLRASIEVKQNQQVLAAYEESHRPPVPARVVKTSFTSNSQATATVEVMAGQGQTYDLALRVYQVEEDPDEIFWSSILLFIPCLFPEVCDDRERVGESFQPIELIPGTYPTISTSYSAAPVSEEGNFISGYEIFVYFEDIFIGK